MPHDPVALPESEEVHIRELNRMLQLGSPALVGTDGERMELPNAVFRLLKDIARNMQLGRAIVLVPENQQLTTQRAADLLGVSRPHLIKLLGAGELPYHKAGSHRPGAVPSTRRPFRSMESMRCSRKRSTGGRHRKESHRLRARTRKSITWPSSCSRPCAVSQRLRWQRNESHPARPCHSNSPIGNGNSSSSRGSLPKN